MEFVNYRAYRNYPDDWDEDKGPLLRRWREKGESGDLLLAVAVMKETIEVALGNRGGHSLSTKRKMAGQKAQNEGAR